MKVVFIEEVPGTAVPGEVKEVKNGFARNFLLPRSLAVPATKAAMQRAESLSKREEKRQSGLDAEAQKIVEQLDGKPIKISARVGEQGRLYGSVTASDIANLLDAVLGEPIDRRRIMLPNPIREVGTRTVQLRLTRNVTATVEVVIEADETSSRGRRSTAPAGGSIIMAPRRGRFAREDDELRDQADETDERPRDDEREADTTDEHDADAGESPLDDEMVEETTIAETAAIESEQAMPDGA